MAFQTRPQQHSWRQRIHALLLACCLGGALPQAQAVSTDWIDIAMPPEYALRAIVARPSGAGPFPVVVILHGSGGFADAYARLAEQFAQAGFLALAGCWFPGNQYPGAGRRPSPLGENIPCPSAPPFQGVQPRALAAVAALIDTARRLPDARADQLGLFGHSRGAQLAVLAVAQGIPAAAVVASAGGWESSMRGDTPLAPLANRIHTPLLLLHGSADPTVAVEQSERFERRLRELGKPVSAYYFSGAKHLLPFQPETADEARQRAIRFFRQQFDGR